MNTNPLDPKIFSPACAERFQAVLDLKSDRVNAEPTWEGCWGAANGWGMMIGPSPGSIKDNSAGETDLMRERRRDSGHFGFGSQMGVADFADDKRTRRSTRRSTNWNKLASAVTYENKSWASALTTVCNLDFLNFAAEKDIPPKRLEQGCPFVFEVMKATKPRVIVPLTKAVYFWLTRYLKTANVFQREQLNPLKLRHPLPLVWIRLPGCAFESLVIQTPKHPSWVPSNQSLKDFSARIAEFCP